MEYRSYIEVKNWGEEGTEKMAQGHCYIFPKLDGIKGSMWMHKNVLQVADNEGQIRMEDEDSIKSSLFTVAYNCVRIIQFLQSHPTCRIYFVWLRPEHIKTYMPEALSRIYITDVVVHEEHSIREGTISLPRYISYDTYAKWLYDAGLGELCVPCICDGINITEEKIKFLADNDNYLILKNKAPGAGIIIKNYYYVDQGKQIFAKLNKGNNND
jgi:hypothetical protein